MRLLHVILWSAVRGERERLRHEPVREQRDLCRQGRRIRVQVLVPDFLIVDFILTFIIVFLNYRKYYLVTALILYYVRF